MPLEILYEDDWLLALNKPSGIVCHTSRGHLKDSLASGLRAYFDETMKDAGIHLLGRLDKDTSGILLIAKNSVAGAMIRQSPPDTLKKTYLAFASGHFPEKHGVIDIPMGEARDEDGILRMVREGKPALTFYEVVGETGDFSMLKLTLGTGRTHQIRFHLSETGHPLLGDALYGQPSPLIGRTALHAETLAFTHPFSKEHLTLFAPLPEDMRRLMENC